MNRSTKKKKKRLNLLLKSQLAACYACHTTADFHRSAGLHLPHRTRLYRRGWETPSHSALAPLPPGSMELGLSYLFPSLLTHPVSWHRNRSSRYGWHQNSQSWGNVQRSPSSSMAWTKAIPLLSQAHKQARCLTWQALWSSKNIMTLFQDHERRLLDVEGHYPKEPPLQNTGPLQQKGDGVLGIKDSHLRTDSGSWTRENAKELGCAFTRERGT